MTEMPPHKRKWVEFLRKQHWQICFEQGDDYQEISTAYSEGADAIVRLHAIDAKEPSTDTPTPTPSDR